MKNRSFAIELHQYLEADSILAEIRLAEQLGYDAVWLGDSQMIWRELYVLLGAAANATSHILLGTGVTNPITRLPSVTASAAVTLQELSKGRILLGIGRGDSSVRTLGLKPSSLTAVEAFVIQLRKLCSGQSVTTNDREVKLTFGSPEKCPPIVIAAAGPRTLKLAGHIGDGVIVNAAIKEVFDCVRAGLTARTDGKEDFKIICSKAVAVHADSKKARAAVRPHIARRLLSYPWTLSSTTAAVQKKLKEVYDYYEHMNPVARHAEVIPDEVVLEFAIAGNAEECAEQVIELFATGIDQLQLRPYGVDGAPRKRTMELFATEVMRRL
jgi:5,10-methylenetetrahydromethanopterin reductase